MSAKKIAKCAKVGNSYDLSVLCASLQSFRETFLTKIKFSEFNRLGNMIYLKTCLPIALPINLTFSFNGNRLRLVFTTPFVNMVFLE